eukprot:scaffold2246_cov162-Amphora_coffeaeformis.AAC.19
MTNAVEILLPCQDLSFVEGKWNARSFVLRALLPGGRNHMSNNSHNDHRTKRITKRSGFREKKNCAMHSSTETAASVLVHKVQTTACLLLGSPVVSVTCSFVHRFPFLVSIFMLFASIRIMFRLKFLHA